MILKSPILDSQSFVLHKNGIAFHQERNGSIYIKVVTSYHIVGRRTLYLTVSIYLTDKQDISWKHPITYAPYTTTWVTFNS